MRRTHTHLSLAMTLALTGAAADASAQPDLCDPEPLATIESSTFVRDVEAVGDVLYVLEDSILEETETGLRIFDVSDPASPVLLAEYPTPGHASDIAIEGGIACLADGADGGLLILDVSDPASPALLGSLALPSVAVDVQGPLAAAVYGDMVNLIDVTDPANPAQVSFFNTGVVNLGVLIHGSTVYVAGGYQGLFTLDLTVPPIPIFTDQLATSGPARGLAIASEAQRLYVAQSDGGLLVADVSFPLLPALVDEVDTPGLARAVAVAGDSLLLADMHTGIEAFDAADPDAPALAGGFTTPRSAVSVAASGGFAYVAMNRGGVQVLRLGACPNCAADFAEPYGLLDLADVTAFVFSFLNPDLDGRAQALAEPHDIADLADVVTFVTSFSAGCP